jgi:ribose transport system permease protein
VSDWRYRFDDNKGTLLAIALFVVMFGVYIFYHPAFDGTLAQFLSKLPNVATTASNKAVLLAIVAMAQTLPILTAGLDLSVGSIFVLANCVASAIVVGSPAETAVGIVGVIAVGALCGSLNGLIVVYGRLQPIITTLATGAIYYGLALALRPTPGGDINSDLADIVTGRIFGSIPAMLIVLLVVVLVVWVPFRRSVLGRAAYAVGSSEPAAYMSGVPVGKAKFLTYLLSGVLASIAGLLLTFITYAGEASASIAGTYTLNSIAAVVIGGVSLFGGVGSAIGAIFGAFVLRTINDLLFVFDMEPLWQPLFLGIILLLAVSLGSFRLLRVRNRLELYS